MVPAPLRPPSIEDPVVLARYPFLPQASEHTKELARTHGIGLDELIESRFMESARTRARARLLEALSSEDGIDPGSSRHLFTEEGRLHEIFSFYYARLVVCATGDERTVSRWAQAEATRAERLLVEDPANLPSIASTYLSNPIQSDVGPSPRAWDGRWRIPLADFIETSPSITGARWRLANAELERGMVILHEEPRYSSDAKLCRLLRERIRASIIEDAASRTASVTDHLRARLADALDMIESLNAQRSRTSLDLAEVDAEAWPPCMRTIIADLASGVNVNHAGRVFLASMASTIEVPQEVAIGFFEGAPDFSRDTTTYQIQHIYDRAYTPSGCGKLKVNACCPVAPGEDALCDRDWMDHPLKYIRATARRMKSANDEAAISRGDGD